MFGKENIFRLFPPQKKLFLGMRALMRVVAVLCCATHASGFLLASPMTARADGARLLCPGPARAAGVTAWGGASCRLPLRAPGRRQKACAWRAMSSRMGLTEWRDTCDSDSGEGACAALSAPHLSRVLFPAVVRPPCPPCPRACARLGHGAVPP